MVNQHFGRASEVWKHLVLATVLSGVRPAGYAETHGGSARNLMDDLPERDYGVRTFLRRVGDYDGLNVSPYTSLVRSCFDLEPPIYPGSAFIALSLMAAETEVLLCDLDPTSAADLRHAAARQHGLRCRVLEQDGIAGVADWLSTAPTPTVVHIDPFDAHARTSSGRTPIEFAAHAADTGAPIAYWYGYDNPSEQSWAMDTLAALTSTPLVCIDMAVLTSAGAGGHGDLGLATTPGTGFGHILANVPAPVIAECECLGLELARLYDGVPLPDGTPGAWRLTTTRSADRGRSVTT